MYYEFPPNYDHIYRIFENESNHIVGVQTYAFREDRNESWQKSIYLYVIYDEPRLGYEYRDFLKLVIFVNSLIVNRFDILTNLKRFI